MSDINCPYCDAELNVDHDDGLGYEEGVEHEMQCEECKKNFIFYTSISFDYEPHKADCLNGADCNYELQLHFPRVYSTMQCEMCGRERVLTDKERKAFGIETIAQYNKLLGLKKV